MLPPTRNTLTFEDEFLLLDNLDEQHVNGCPREHREEYPAQPDVETRRHADADHFWQAMRRESPIDILQAIDDEQSEDCRRQCIA